MATSSPPILQLPPELVLRVASHLTTTELGAFRLISRGIERICFETFAKQFFTKRQFMLEQVSLEALAAIANHQTLSPYLTELLIGCDGFAKQLYGDDETAKAFERRRNDGHIDRDILKGTGRAQNLLVDAFSKLKNLRVVGLRDYDGRGRSRDGGDARWRSYGWSYGYRDKEIAAQLRRWNLPLPEDQSIVPLIFLSLGLAGCRPLSFEAVLRRARITPLSLWTATRIQPDVVIPVLSGLKRVMLNLDHTPGSNDADSSNFFCGLKEFLSHTIDLNHLRLNLESGDRNFDDFLTWFHDPGTNFMHLHQLTVLELGNFNAKPINLIHMITKLRLRNLSLWRIALLCKDQAAYDAEPSVWSSFLASLGTALPSTTELQSVLVGQCHQRMDEQSAFVRATLSIEFADHVTMDENGDTKYEGLRSDIKFRKRYGSDVRQWFNNLSGRVYISRRNETQSAPDDGSGEDDDASDGGEDENEEEPNHEAEQTEDVTE